MSGGTRIAGSMRTARSTSSGRRAVTSITRRPPKLWPIQEAGSVNVSRRSATWASSVQGSSQPERPWPRRSGARTWKPAEALLRQLAEARAVSGDAVEADDRRGGRIAPLVDVEAHQRATGACPRGPRRAGKRLAPVAHEPDVRRLEDRGALVRVQRGDHAGLHRADEVLEGAAHADGEVEAWRDGASGEADLPVLRQPARVGDVAARAQAAPAGGRGARSPRVPPGSRCPCPRRARRQRRRARTPAVSGSCRRSTRRVRGSGSPSRAKAITLGLGVVARLDGLRTSPGARLRAAGVVAPMITETMFPPIGRLVLDEPACLVDRQIDAVAGHAELELARDARAVVAARRGRGNEERVRQLPLDDLPECGRVRLWVVLGQTLVVHDDHALGAVTGGVPSRRVGFVAEDEGDVGAAELACQLASLAEQLQREAARAAVDELDDCPAVVRLARLLAQALWLLPRRGGRPPASASRARIRSAASSGEDASSPRRSGAASLTASTRVGEPVCPNRLSYSCTSSTRSPAAQTAMRPVVSVASTSRLAGQMPSWIASVTETTAGSGSS